MRTTIPEPRRTTPRGMRIARTALMPHPTHRHGGLPSHWAPLPRAHCAIVVVIAATACGGSRGTGDDDGHGRPPPHAGEYPSDTGGDADAAGGPGTVTVTVTGPGRITSTPAGIDCGAGGTTCPARFDGATAVLQTDSATTERWGCGRRGTG